MHTEVWTERQKRKYGRGTIQSTVAAKVAAVPATFIYSNPCLVNSSWRVEVEPSTRSTEKRRKGPARACGCGSGSERAVRRAGRAGSSNPQQVPEQKGKELSSRWDPSPSWPRARPHLPAAHASFFFYNNGMNNASIRLPISTQAPGRARGSSGFPPPANYSKVVETRAQPAEGPRMDASPGRPHPRRACGMSSP